MFCLYVSYTMKYCLVGNEHSRHPSVVLEAIFSVILVPLLLVMHNFRRLSKEVNIMMKIIQILVWFEGWMCLKDL